MGVLCQKHVVYPKFERELESLAEWRHFGCFARNMWFIQNLNANLKVWPNGDIPGALPETCGLSKIETELEKFGRMATFRVLCQKHVVYPKLKPNLKNLTE